MECRTPLPQPLKLRSGESNPKTASDIRSAVMAHVRMHVPELYGIMFVIIRFLETPVTLESWEPVRNYDISAIQSEMPNIITVDNQVEYQYRYCSSMLFALAPTVLLARGE